MVRFDPEYPFKSPAVQFVVSDKVKPPVHPVRYPSRQLNVHICTKLTASLPPTFHFQSTSTRMATYVATFNDRYSPRVS
jgi:hypothetical protein